jgi:hypothetical protein
MSGLTDSEVLDILLPLIDARPEFRRQLGLHLVELLHREVDQDMVSGRARPAAFRKPQAPLGIRAVSTDDPAFAMFVHVRRLVIHAQRPLLKDFEIERQLQEDWAKVTTHEKAKWLELANGQKQQPEAPAE